MTGLTIIDNIPFFTGVDKRVLSLLFYDTLLESSSYKLTIEQTITVKDLKKVLKLLKNNVKTGEIQKLVNRIMEIVDMDILDFYARFPDELTLVEDTLKEQAETGDIGDISLASAMKDIYRTRIITHLVPSLIEYMEDLVEKTKEQEQ